MSQFRPYIACAIFVNYLFAASALGAADTDVDIYPSALIRAESPSVVLLQGANVDKSQYSRFASALASEGFHVIIQNVRRSVPGVPEPGFFSLEETVTDAFARLKRENVDPASQLYQRVRTDRLAVVGHSFGGMAALLAVDGRCAAIFCLGAYQRPVELRAAVVLGTSTYTGGSFFPVDTSAAPVAFISGEFDSGAPPSAVSGSFDRVSTPKAWLEITGANHFAMTNQNPSPGAKPDPHPQSIEQDQSIALSSRWTAVFLRAFAADDATARQELERAVLALPPGLSLAKFAP